MSQQDLAFHTHNAQEAARKEVMTSIDTFGPTVPQQRDTMGQNWTVPRKRATTPTKQVAPPPPPPLPVHPTQPPASATKLVNPCTRDKTGSFPAEYMAAYNPFQGQQPDSSTLPSVAPTYPSWAHFSAPAPTFLPYSHPAAYPWSYGLTPPYDGDKATQAHRVNAQNTLKYTEERYRVKKSFSEAEDDGKTVLHPVRFEPAPNCPATDLFKMGCLSMHDPPPSLPFDLSHVGMGTNIDSRAFLAAAQCTEEKLRLTLFLPSPFHSLTGPNRNIDKMDEFTKAFFTLSILTRRIRPWDYSLEVLHWWLIRHHFFEDQEVPVQGFYRSGKQASACAAFVEVFTNQSAQKYRTRETMNLPCDMDSMFSSHASDNTSMWSKSPPVSYDKHPRIAKPRRGAPAKENQLQSIARECRNLSYCIIFNKGLQCNRNFDSANNTCSRVGNDGKTVSYHHLCAKKTGGATCSQKHPATQHK